ANYYRPFREVQSTLLTSLTTLLSTSPPSPTNTPSVSLSGALTLALTYTNALLASSSSTTKNPTLDPTASTTTTINPTTLSQTTNALTTRILILSVTGSLSSQYIPLTNSIFACQRLSIPIDVAKLAGDAVFLEQASDATRGIYLNIGEKDPRGLLQYLMMAFLPDQVSRRYLMNPGKTGVDFRAACFCHRKVVDLGFVCIFCAPPDNAVCLTCGTQLKLGNYGQKPIVVARKKKKRKNRIDGTGETGSGAATPVR
ncbi:MAG: hypothetical protein L6R41_006659, partial [Letrouitia leprolyta]